MSFSNILIWFILDIKHIDDEEHKKLTGHTNKNILDCATYLSEQGIPMWIRHVLVPGITDNDEYLKRTRAFIDTLKTVQKVEVLPYHTLGAYKWKELGIPYSLRGRRPSHSRQSQKMQNASWDCRRKYVLVFERQIYYNRNWLLINIYLSLTSKEDKDYGICN